jgi:hypothetical protein
MWKKFVLILLSVVASVSVFGAASAQDATPEPPAQNPLPMPAGNGPILGDLLQIIAQDLNLEPKDVLQQMRGQTLAEVIAAQNGDATKITADIVAAVTERVNQAVANGRLTQERADQMLANLTETVTQALNGELRGQFPGFFGGMGGMGGLRPGLNQNRPGLNQNRPGLNQNRPNMLNRDVHPLMSAVQDALGLTGRQLVDEMRGGKTLGEVIAAHNGDADAIVSAAIATATERLDAVRERGTLTQEQETAMLDGLKAFYQAVLNGAFRPGGLNTAPAAPGSI